MYSVSSNERNSEVDPYLLNALSYPTPTEWKHKKYPMNQFGSYFHFTTPEECTRNASGQNTIRHESVFKQERVSDLLKTFCTETSAHGLPHLVKDSGWTVIRFIWLVIFTCAMLGECIHLMFLIQQYLEYPSMDSFQVSETEPEFPAVTICNTEPFSDLGYWDSHINDTPGFDHYYYWAGTIPLDAAGNDNYTFWNRINSAKGMFENVNRTEITLVGHQLKDLVLFCSYRGVQCDYSKDFVRFVTPTFYNCYTYNAPNSMVDVGPDKGLTVILFLEGNPAMSPYDKWFTRDSHVEQTFGARLENHQKGTLPNPVLSGINILPGHSTALALKQSTRTKLGSPYSSCETRDKLTDLKDYKYSTERCYDICKLQYVYNKCGCVNPDTPIPDSLLGQSVRYCGTYNESSFNTTDSLDEWVNNIHCEKNATVSFVTRICDEPDYPSCKEPCVYSTYEESVSQIIWPSVLALEDVFHDFVRGNWKAVEILGDPYHKASNSSQSHFRDLMWYNLARVNIYFDKARVISIKEIRSISIYDLFAGIGGTIGLWAGLSMITVLEFISLPFQFLYLYFKRSTF